MLFKASLHSGIRDGSVTMAFRRWKRPTVKAGGTLITPVGQLAIDSVEPVSPESITDEDARRAGAADRDQVHAELRDGKDRQLYRITFHLVGDDPRVALRDEEPDAGALSDLTDRLRRLDRRSSAGPWTTATLDVIFRRPETVARELAAEMGTERDVFKRRVRQLKALGLTESLPVGYRLAPRGRHLLRHLKDRRPG